MVDIDHLIVIVISIKVNLRFIHYISGTPLVRFYSLSCESYSYICSENPICRWIYM